MKFKTYLSEAISPGSLLGRSIGGGRITKKTKTEHWEDHFDISGRNLTSLEYSPATVDGHFDCSNNQLTSLKHAPSSVYGFSCDNNQLTSLEHGPTKFTSTTRETWVRGRMKWPDYWCRHNKLTTLIGAPPSIDGGFCCSHNELITLIGAPTFVKNNFDCRDNILTSLEGGPTSVSSYECKNNKLTSLHDIHKKLKECKGFWCENNPIKEAVLGLLLIKGLNKVVGLPFDDIINKYLPNKTGMEAVSRCQDELEEAGFGEFAEL